MATLLLSAAGSAIGGAIGGPIGALAGRAAGALAGSVIDQATIGALSPRPKVEGPRLTSVDITASTEGAPITRVVGRTRLAGQMIWATRFLEEETTTTEGGKGGGGGAEVKEYKYYANFAVAFCEGPITRFGRVWGDGRELPVAENQETTKKSASRRYLGTEDQVLDSLIETKEGADNAPAYRGVAYIVFEHMPLKDFGNRIPVITAEVYRKVGDLEPLVKGVSMIPGTTEFGYDNIEITQETDTASYAHENRHSMLAKTDLEASLDLLADLAPNCSTLALVVAWFGTDLRCEQCEIKPKVENNTKATVLADTGESYPWIVAEVPRSTADVVSQVNGRPAFGGSPNDASVIHCIQELKDRGFTVLFYPFIMMDIAAGNTLADPYSDNASTVGQPLYPWRGRITISPAPGFAGSPDKTATAGSQVSTFLGTATAADFSTSSGTTVKYTGTSEWSYRRFVLHMAKLCELAGGVDMFCVGTEMVHMTRSRDGATSYPFVDGLIDIAAEARSMLGAGTRIGYAADWSEYHSHRPDDGSNDVLFNLDPLWANGEIDFVGIDNYLPLADWRDGTEHLDYDAENGPTTIYDQTYLKANVEGGEYYDYFYPSAGATGNEASAERIAQTRTAIEDTSAAAEHWVFRNKDIRNWWQNAHHDRPAGTRSGTPTAWTPESKPIIFTELGCPAVDKGANQPNVFVDPKSSESFVPYFSSGARDDAMQRAYLEATIAYWNANNPSSGVYAGQMLETASTCVWAWDARMVPSFPQDDRTWADAPNWELGHWISGRLGAASGTETFTQLMNDYGFADYAVEPIGAVVDAVILDKVMSARDVIDALAPAYVSYAVESQGKIRLRSRLSAPVRAELTADDLAESGAGSSGDDLFSKRRAQESELPAVVKLSYGEPTNADLSGAVEARRLSDATGSRRTLDLSIPVVMAESRARAVAETLLHDAWAAREGLELALPPSHLGLDAGDVVRFTSGGVAETFRAVEIGDGEARRLRLARHDGSVLAAFATGVGVGGGGGSRGGSGGGGGVTVPPLVGKPEVVYFDGPLLSDDADRRSYTGYLAAYLSPWPDAIDFYRAPSGSNFQLVKRASLPARIGTTAFDFFSGPVWRWDRGNELFVDLLSGSFSSAAEIDVLGGANALAIENADGEWEIVQFVTAELVSAGRYKLTQLLRGQRGSEHARRDPVAAGARVLALDRAVITSALSFDQANLELVWRAGPSNRPHTDASYKQETVTFDGKGMRPFAPVHVAGRRPTGTNDIKLMWKRRARAGGDSWDQEAPTVLEPLSAVSWEVDILDGAGGAVLRTLTSTDTNVTYTAADQTSDFGAPIAFPDTLSVVVYQISSFWHLGRGIGAAATLHFPLPVEV